ncbi:MAG TPA: hypothetical protein PLP85_07160 [Alcaligenes sp.]|nr:hypothetical protein [Alcaligenes sp.]
MTADNISTELHAWHKRQAALMHYFASLEYLQGLKTQVDELIIWTDAVLSQRAPFDAIGLADLRWDPTDTSAHFSTYAFPALLDFQQGVAADIASRASDQYGLSGAYQCARMLSEYGHSMLWATREQEDAFQEKFARIYSYADNADGILRRFPTRNDFSYWNLWNEYKHLFPRLPRFKIRTDIEGHSGSVPPRTGLYVPQTDPYGALQFAWTRGYGELGPVCTLNEFGHQALQAVGRHGLWDDEQGLFAFALEHLHLGIQKDDLFQVRSNLPDFSTVPLAVSRLSIEEQPCSWYFVELIDGEFEEHDGTYTQASSSINVTAHPPSILAGQPCPRSGWWFTPAKNNSRTRFDEGDVMPDIPGNHYGSVIWQWDSHQDSPRC